MFDLFLTIALIYVAYRGYNWYTAIQARVQGGPGNQEVEDEEIIITRTPKAGGDDDFIEYEEID